MALVHFKQADFDAAVDAAPLAVVDFWADWCGPCKMTAPELEAFSQEYDDVKVCKINVDESADLAAMYGIMSIPTMILVKNGKEADRHVGGCEKADIRAFCDKNM